MSVVNVTAIILAAGSGTRMNSTLTKQRMTILGKTVLFRSVSAFSECVDVDEIIIVSREDEIAFVKEETRAMPKVKAVVPGGKTRAESAKLGFDAISNNSGLVAIHDAARCLITPSDISRVISDAVRYGAATASAKIFDTVKRIDTDGFSVKTENRSELVVAQTPQIFRTDLYREALSLVDCTDPSVTDDNMIVENAGTKVFCTETSRDNVKITCPADLVYAEYVIKRRGE